MTPIVRLAELCRPVEPQRVMDAIEAAGFSPDAYLAATAELWTSAPTSEQASLHFLVEGFAARRHFAIDLAPAPLQTLLALPAANPVYLVHLAAALCHAYLCEDDLDTHIETKWPTVAGLRTLGATPFLLIGSSEAKSYVQSGVRAHQWLMPLALLSVGSAAMGLVRASVRSAFADRLGRFIRTVDGLPAGRSIPCLCKFGQVDVEFAYHLSRVRDNRLHYDRDGFRQFCVRSVERYAAFLKGLAEITDRSRITVASVFPSSLSDQSWADMFLKRHAGALREELGEAELDRRVRALEIPDQLERVAMTRTYNRLLRSTVTPSGFRFLDDFEILLNAYGVLDETFTRRGKGQNCHLDFVPASRQLTTLLWQLTDEYSSSPRKHTDRDTGGDETAAMTGRSVQPAAALA